VRLNHVRRRLLSPEWKSRTISRIALDCGFWHLSQFAADYRRMFGETPSATRAARSREISLDAGLDRGDRNLLSRAGMAGAIP
jgi:AraC-like DNA-binding protein